MSNFAYLIKHSFKHSLYCVVSNYCFSFLPNWQVFQNQIQSTKGNGESIGDGQSTVVAVVVTVMIVVVVVVVVLVVIAAAAAAAADSLCFNVLLVALPHSLGQSSLLSLRGR